MIMNELRKYTKRAHDDLEEAAPMAQLMKPDLTVSAYTNLLSRLLPFYRNLEDQLQSWGLPEPGAPPVEWKTPRLLNDLKVLTGDLHSCFTDMNVEVETPTIASRSAALGALYVLEGSALGGQIISRRLSRQPAIKSTGAWTFFTCYDQRELQLHWREFSRYMNDRSWDAKEEEAALRAAEATFDSLNNWMAESYLGQAVQPTVQRAMNRLPKVSEKNLYS